MIMTLNTSVLILDPTDRDELYEFVNGLLVLSSEFDSDFVPEKSVTEFGIGNHLGQGLPAILDIDAHADGKTMITPEHSDYCEDDCEHWSCTTSRYAEISFDTAYGYRGPAGENCNTLHMSYILNIAEWAKERNLRVMWSNEYTGELHSPDDTAAIVKFLGSGDDAMKWFNDTVAKLFSEGTL